MAKVLKPRLTTDEFFDMAHGNVRMELIRGEVIQLSPAGGEHGIVAQRIGAKLFVHVEANRLGVVCAAETGFTIARNPDTVRAPDASFISKERIGDMKPPKKFWPFAPDLAVEVVSPSDTAEAVQDKVRSWFAGGTRMVWVLYPTPRTVHVYRSPTDVQILQVGDTLSGEPVVPGFACSVADIFA